jgi:gas vesicle protein
MDLWGWVAAAVVAIVGFLSAIFFAKRSGAKEEQAKQTEQALQQAKESSETKDKIHGMSDPDLADELRKHQRD